MPFHPKFPLPDLDWMPLQPFWAAAERGSLVIPRCDLCEEWVWYPRPMCPTCNGLEITWTPVSGRGRVFTWTVVHHAFLPAFRDQVPFITGLVALAEDPGVRLATLFVDCSADELECDAPAEVVFRPLEFAGVEGTVMAPLWRPVAG